MTQADHPYSHQAMSILYCEDALRLKFRYKMRNAIKDAMSKMDELKSGDIHFGVGMFDDRQEYHELLPRSSLTTWKKCRRLSSGVPTLADWTWIVKVMRANGYQITYHGSDKGFRLRTLADVKLDADRLSPRLLKYLTGGVIHLSRL
jgi:hypothetical protein